VGNYPDAPVPLRAPEQVGQYKVVYLTADRAIGEAVFSVVDVSATLQAPAEVQGNTRFQVAWQGPGNQGDTVSLYPVGGQRDVAYQYVDPQRGERVTLAAPESPGDYELRYLTHGGRVLATRSLRVTPPTLEPGGLRVLPADGLRLGQDDAVQVVLDASGSMLQRQGGERRIDIARRTLLALVNETIPEGTPFALRVFGHKQADACRTDLELPLAPLDRGVASARLRAVNAKNLAKTPIAQSLSHTAGDLRGVSGERVIVLVTDGEETCDGDPAAAIAALRRGAADLRVNIVGYAIDDTGLRETFARWARLGGGEYFDASGEEELAGALLRSISPAFTVVDADGLEVAGGVAGGDQHRLAPGDYRVVSGGLEYPVSIKPATVTEVTLRP